MEYTLGGNGGRGGAIYCNADLDLVQCVIANHMLGTGGAGCATILLSLRCADPGKIGGIFINNDGPATPMSTIDNSSLTGNEDTAILNIGTLTVTNTIISNNGGTGLENLGSAAVETTTISDNSRGGVRNGTNNDPAVMTIDHSTIARNDTGSGGVGGGLNNRAESTLTLTNSTVASNVVRAEVIFTNPLIGLPRLVPRGGGGGGIFNSGFLTLVNSTVTGNECFGASRTDPFNGGVVNAPGVGGGIFSLGQQPVPATLTIENSLIANNADSGDDEDIFGMLSSEVGVNLLSTTNGLSDAGAFAGIVADAQLAPLGDYGGETETAPPLAASPAIDAGVNNGLTTDQRGLPRIVDGDGDTTATIDLGAVEAQISLEVTNSGSTGAGSLRDAIALVTFPGSRITFDPSVFEGEPEDVISLAEELCVPAGLSFSIDASNIAGGVTLSGDATVRVLKNSGALVMTNIIIEAGLAPVVGGILPDPDLSCGGGIWNLGELALNDCIVRNCVAGRGQAFFAGGSGPEGASGGGICNDGALSLNRCQVINNRAGAGGDGNPGPAGSISNNPGDGGNGGRGGSGGGLSNSGSLMINLSTVARNDAGAGGTGGNGAEGNFFGPPANGGSGGDGGSGGGIWNTGTVVIDRSTISSNAASDRGLGGTGAPANVFGPGGTHGIPGISGRGGGLSNASTLTITNSTVAENTGGTSGDVGGLDNLSGATAALVHVTLAGNSSVSASGGIANEGDLQLTNSIVANNTGAVGPDILGEITSESGVNLLSDLAGLSGVFNGLVTDPQLLPLDDHGGLTETMPPLGGSPAIDGAIDTGALPSVDQPGNARLSGPAPDIGAVEILQVLDGPLGPGDPGQLLLDVTVQTVPGRWYQLQELDDPENGTYLPLPATNTEATGSETTIRVSLPAGQGLFRAAEFEVEP